ncbi:DNA-directed RNA polymerase [Lachnellula suecica]|uniref:DNA-directed RNA polymerase n=1 Tax=Lachnellula suecica TaxID=602035 RepID=A0A8T9CC90_9HELO|nr:DNA-directed RNA polymerase [Lachnellula suecica]
MLVRAARRKARSVVIRSQPFEQLYHSRLRSAHDINPLDRRRWATLDSGSLGAAVRRRRNSNDARNIQTRSMATHLDASPTDDIPFERFNVLDNPYSYIRPRDRINVTNPFQDLETSTQRIRTSRKTAVGGEVAEILAVFYACLQIGKMDRAGVILQRLTSKADAGIEDLADLHTKYLRASVEHIILSPSESARQAIHKWFELEIRRKGIPYDAEMIAYMIKASLQAPVDAQGGNQSRLVQRYMGMVESEEDVWKIMDLEILTHEEKNQTMNICPDYNMATTLQDSEMLSQTFEIDMEEVKVVDQAIKEHVQEHKPLAEVRPTKQKGLGLTALKKSLSMFSNTPGLGLDLANKTFGEKREIQARLEEDAVSSAIERWRDESNSLKKMGLDSTLQTKSLGARMAKWHTALEEHLKEEITKVDAAELMESRNEEDTERLLYGPFLRTLRVDKLAAVTILTVMSGLGAQGVDKGLLLSQAILLIAGSVEDESIFEALHQSNRKNIWPKRSAQKLEMDKLRKMVRTRGSGSAAGLVDKLKGRDDEVASFVWKQWPLSMKAKVGAVLMSALIKVAKVPVTLEHAETKVLMTQLQPAFSHTFKYKMGKKFGVIMPNKTLVESLKREPVHSLLAKHLPMLVEPDPWTLFNKGGFIVHPSKLMRVKLGDKDQRHYAEAAISHGDLSDLCKGLDVLGKTEWNINQPVFDVMLEAWNSGEAIGNISPEFPALTIPPEPTSTQDPLQRRKWIQAVKSIENQRTGLHSQRCFQNFQLEIARALRNQTFYFPHNVDFRGRAYPIPPYLNHMGADHCRGLLKFGKGKELGVTGLRWLKIHLANVFGFDKASLSERENFADTHLENIRESVANPLGGTRWWLEAEDPWQFLAASMELINALNSPDPTRFVSNLPVHQDGTCNGLQHYAALGGDSWGARQVNLEPGDRPADVYTAVADLVKESIAKDRDNGNPLATLLEGKITRKTVKQTVMTNVYGVTFVGARDQVKKQLVAAHDDLPNDSTMNPQILSSYIATKIFTALSTMFRGANDIQYWFGQCATRISTCLTPEQIDRLEGEWGHLTDGSKKYLGTRHYNLEDALQFRSTVIWTTPLHMPVVQPYRAARSRSISTTMQSISLQEPHQSQAVSRRKQLQGFPPNFIHSLDATHMILSALQSDELGLSFAAVHDSFWTHACDIDKMNGVLRDAFIKIHEEDVIGRLHAEFTTRYKNCLYLSHVHRKSKAGLKIMQWRKENAPKRGHIPIVKKAPRLEELLLERKRLRLLDSSDPAEVEEGKNMVTPGSIFAEFSSEESLPVDSELKEIGLGAISTRHLQAASDDSDAALSEDPVEAVDANEEVSEKEELTPFEKAFARGEDSSKLNVMPVWLSLTFPPVPKKGDFDVSRLRDSQYFFS